MFRFVSYKPKKLQSSYLVYIYNYMNAAAASHNCSTLTYISWLTDLVFGTVLKANFSFGKTFETKEFILREKALPFRAAAAVHSCSLLCPLPLFMIQCFCLIFLTLLNGLTSYLAYTCTRGYQKVLSLTWKEPEIWICSALFFNVVPFQLHTLVPSSFPVINTRSVEVNILVP